ncbi:MAG: ammonium transporter [Geminicoccaceae bacterium]
MSRIAKTLGLGAVIGAAAMFIAGPAHAEVSAETAFVLNTFMFLVTGFLVMWMAAGFAMLEAGLVRKRSVGVQLLKNISLYSIAGIMYYIIGYNVMYVGVDGGYFGSFIPFYNPSAEELALVGGEEGATFEALGEAGYSIMSDWFFQMVFVATTASIVSGAVAERAKLWPFLAFVAVLTGVLYPITGSWGWGGGWLSEMGFSDFAGSTIVHSVGGWAALAGVIAIGPRAGKYDGGRINVFPGSSLPLATLGTFILWLGWFGFNGGSQLALGSAGDAIAISNIFVNTNLAACGGVVVAMILTQIMYGKVDLTMALNGALAGLVSITAEPLAPSPLLAIIIGGIGGVIVVFAVPMLDRMPIDDVVGAIPVHLFAGVWGTLAVGISTGDFVVQAIGIVAYGAFTFVASLAVWFLFKAAFGVRIAPEDEEFGIDQAELGMEAYPEFGATQ